MPENDDELNVQEKALLERVDQLIDIHGGDLRGVIETLLMAYDEAHDSVSRGYVRRRFER